MNEIDPPVWRQMIVPSKLTLENLHPLGVAAFDIRPWSSRRFHITEVKRCQLAGQGTVVTQWNRSGYTILKYTLDDPVHLMFKDGFDLEDEKETTSYRFSGMQRAFMEMSRSSIPRRPKYTLEKTTNLGNLNEQYKLSRKKHALVYDRGDIWEYLIMIEGVRGAYEGRMNWRLLVLGTVGFSVEEGSNRTMGRTEVVDGSPSWTMRLGKGKEDSMRSCRSPRSTTPTPGSWLCCRTRRKRMMTDMWTGPTRAR